MGKKKKTKEEDIILDDKIVEEKTTETEEAEVERILTEIEDASAEETVSEETTLEEVIPEETPSETVGSEETPSEEIASEEAPLEEIASEEAPLEEIASEEAPSEEIASEEAPSEETIEENGEKKIRWWKKINMKIALITTGSILGTLLVVYFGFVIYFSTHFVFNTTVNGINCSGKTVKDVEAIMQSQVEKYVLVVEERYGIGEKIVGKDFDIKYKGVKTIQERFEQQNPYLWFVSLFENQKITAEVVFDYDEQKLDKVISELECLKEEKQIVPISAKPVFVNGAYEIEEETLGTLIDSERLYKVIHERVDSRGKSVDLDANECYVKPTYTKESPEVINATEALNMCLKAVVTYSLDEIVVTVDASQIANWISVDENLNVLVDENQVRAFTDTLGAKYDTPNSALDLVTPTGKVVNIPNARLGRVVGSASECSQLIKEIRAGEVVTRAPIFAQGGSPGGDPVWGSTYLEVDIAAQHMWYIVDGAVAHESDVVTGSPGRDTPAGVFTILEKKRNKTLVGNIVPSTGQPEYRTPVAYWMRVTWSGVGFHDATWQPAFGGELYKQGRGSHGCINMPLDSVKVLYDMVNEGCPVVIHH